MFQILTSCFNLLNCIIYNSMFHKNIKTKKEITTIVSPLLSTSSSSSLSAKILNNKKFIDNTKHLNEKELNKFNEKIENNINKNYNFKKNTKTTTMIVNLITKNECKKTVTYNKIINDNSVLLTKKEPLLSKNLEYKESAIYFEQNSNKCQNNNNNDLNAINFLRQFRQSKQNFCNKNKQCSSINLAHSDNNKNRLSLAKTFKKTVLNLILLKRFKNNSLLTMQSVDYEK